MKNQNNINASAYESTSMDLAEMFEATYTPAPSEEELTDMYYKHLADMFGSVFTVKKAA